MNKDFAALYFDAGRPSSRACRGAARTAGSSALLLQAFYGLRSERQLMEQLKQRKTIVDDATAASEAYGISQNGRKMIECLFGWGRQHGTIRKTKHRGLAAVAGDFLINMIAYNLIRIPKLLVAQAGVRPKQ